MTPTWSTACLDWEERIVQRRSLIPFDPLFPDQAAAALAVFKSLHIVDLPGKPTFGEACDQWVFDFVSAIFGAYDHSSVRRLIRKFLLLISKKNSKSTIAAGIMVTALIRNWRFNAELLILAPTIEVAGNSFDPAAGMVRHDPELDALLDVIDHQRLIKHRTTGAELKIVAANKDVVSGTKAAFVLVDELWLFGKRPTAKAMLREATGGLSSAREGFVVYLTTHSDEEPRGVFKDELDHFRGVRDGVINDPTSLGVLYEYPPAMLERDAFLEPANFYVTNPNMGRSVHVDWLESELAQEQRGVGDGLQVFLAKHLNVEIGTRLSRDRWTGAEFWDAAVEPGLTLDAMIRRCEVMVAGVDGGGLDDLLGLCLIGREKGSKRWLVWAHAWAWSIVWDRRKDIVTKLDELVNEKSLTKCAMPDHASIDLAANDDEDLTEDVRGVVEVLVRVRDAGLFPDTQAIGLDPVGVASIIDELSEKGFTQAQLAPIGQGYKLSSAVKGSARKLAARTMRHAGSAMMQWCVGNAKMEPRGTSAVAIVKASASAKIDPLAAMFNAVMLMSYNPEAVGGSVYATRGVIRI